MSSESKTQSDDEHCSPTNPRVDEDDDANVPPRARVDNDWILDENSNNTVALCHLPSIEEFADGTLTPPIARYTTEYLREWIELVEMLGYDAVTLRLLQNTGKKHDRALVADPGRGTDSEIASALAPRLGTLPSVAEVETDNPEQAAPTTDDPTDVPVDETRVEVTLTREEFELDLIAEYASGAAEVVDSLSLPEDDIEHGEDVAKATLRFDQSDQ